MMKNVLILLALLILTSSCISKKTYNAKVDELNALKKEQSELVKKFQQLESQDAEESQKDLRTDCSEWNCRKKCCYSKWGFTFCEPGCYSMCESHNMICQPSLCNILKTIDPAYETVASAFKLAVEKKAIQYKEDCISLAEGNAELAKFVCNATGGGIFCTVGGTFTETEGKCACEELNLPNRPPQSCKNDEYWCDEKHRCLNYGSQCEDCGIAERFCPNDNRCLPKTIPCRKCKRGEVECGNKNDCVPAGFCKPCRNNHDCTDGPCIDGACSQR